MDKPIVNGSYFQILDDNAGANLQSLLAKYDRL